MATKSTTPRKRAQKKDTVGLNVYLPTPLHRQLRVKAITEGLDLSGAIAAAVATWVGKTR